MKKTKILIVEDVELASVTRILESEKFEIIQEQGYVAALERIQAEDFDIILLDISLSDYAPNKDVLGDDSKVGGFLLAEKIRLKGEVPIIFMSASFNSYVPAGTSYYKEDSLLQYKDVLIQFYPFNLFDKTMLLKPTVKKDLRTLIQQILPTTSNI